jgi:amiloride-sensitive sodium channel
MKIIKVKYFSRQNENNESTINVRMNMDDMIVYRRYQQFTSSDVVSYVGGILGLFAGISMLSIVEFFYFFTIRLSTDLWRILHRH